ncbi:hypothetical protein FGB62_48g16 [Gracilaria domingensis]|nr:hypothetical protein FGB62_48g16 [Gracilaria domingensis]
MASSRSRPPDPLKRNGARRPSRSHVRASAEHSEALHHSDDELFSARVAALIAERRRLQRQALIHRLQHLKAAILSSQLNGLHESAHQQLLRSAQRRDHSRSQQPSSSSSSLVLPPSSAQSSSSNLAVPAQGASWGLPEQAGTERGAYPRSSVPPEHPRLETDEARTGPAQLTERVLSDLTPFDHERLQVPLSDWAPIDSSSTLAHGTSGGITTPAPPRSTFPIPTPSSDVVQPLLHSETGSFTTQSSSSVNPGDVLTTTQNVEAHEPKLPAAPSPSSEATSNAEYERTARSIDFALNPIEASSPEEPLSELLRRDSGHLDTSHHSVSKLPVRDHISGFRSSTNQSVQLGTESSSSYELTQRSPSRSLRRAIIEGHVNLVSPLLRFEAQLFSSFVTDINKPLKSGKRCFRGTLSKDQEVFQTQTGPLLSRQVQREPGSVSRLHNLLYGDLQSSYTSVRLKDVLNPLHTYPSKLTPLESGTFGNLSAPLSAQIYQSHGNIGEQPSNICPSSTAVTQPLTLLSTVFFDLELKSLIDKSFRLSYIPRDKSLLEAARISDHISCIIDHQYQNSMALKHVLSGQESKSLSKLYVEPQHLDISNSSTSPQWMLDLQKSLGKVRIPVAVDFQRRTYLNMSERDERRAPTALWHFDNANSSQHADQLTEFPQARPHVAYATATDTRRYSSYYSNQGVHSSPGDTRVALNFGFQTRTNYPFRKTYGNTQRRVEESKEPAQTPVEAALSRDVLTGTEFSVVTSKAFQDGIFFDASNTDSTLRAVGKIDDETPVYSISEEGKLIARKD